jgi:hypothetical protein
MDEKGRCSHQEQRPSPGDFVREFIHSRASAENPVPSQATVVISYPVGRPALSRRPFLMLFVTKTHFVLNAKFFHERGATARPQLRFRNLETPGLDDGCRKQFESRHCNARAPSPHSASCSPERLMACRAIAALNTGSVNQMSTRFDARVTPV